MRRLSLLLPLLALLAAAAMPVLAQERILAYHSDIDIHADGSLDVTETIRVRAEGNQIRRGIYRDFPTRYKDRYGNRVVVGFEVTGVQRDGSAESWFNERLDNGERINTGSDALLRVPADYTYTLRYRTTRQLGFFDDHDELYFNAVGTGWDFPIEQSSVEVRLPHAVATADMHVEGYLGAQGERDTRYVATLPAPGQARLVASRPLSQHEGMTVVVTFPKGVVLAPTRAQRIAWLLQDNSAILVALLGYFLLLGYCILRWRTVGRDPDSGTIITRYDPPDGHTPAGLRFIKRSGYDNRCFSADVLASAVDGDLRIDRDKHLLGDKWTLTKVGAREGTTREQAALQAQLFPGDETTLKLDNANAALVLAAITAHRHVLDARFDKVMFRRNGGSIGIAALIAVLVLIAAVLVGVAFGSGMVLLVPVLVLMVATVIVFGVVVKAPTTAGRRILDEIEGFRRYLGVAERDELARMPGPDAPPMLDAKRYERLLPYAVALEVEDAWTGKFTLAVGAAAAAAATSTMAWYHGGGGIGDIGHFTQSIGSSLTSQISSSSTPPGSSSGGGGGGSSGGGGGGGGGGGR